jgi:amidophosphoribosyltransferase
MIDNISVHKARMRMGVKLGEKILRLRPDHDIDVVIPIPDTSRDAALEIANVLGVKYREGFIKNRYVGRTFIMPGQGERAKSVRASSTRSRWSSATAWCCWSTIPSCAAPLSSRSCRWRAMPAPKVYLASAAPPVRYPNVYGIDMPSATNWSRTAAARRTSSSCSAATG